MWRICGKPVRDHDKNRGCTCGPQDPTPWLAREAIDRLGPDDREEDTGDDQRSPQPAPARRRHR